MAILAKFFFEKPKFSEKSEKSSKNTEKTSLRICKKDGTSDPVEAAQAAIRLAEKHPYLRTRS